ncbi:hypothetical protein HMPREF1624_05199 [Sporothrix schenckii ATCC 58251]|uniref:Molybdenum cofactor sulfurase n=1 Tax=Sporothrix schenckii (strain ATCC 58251 / de Perez 2211183) TaxID=1391915 RepID=U7PVD8_SPOS1|nr:hypothetical protein HMPREF1624_05199 [Sporothrix schenckii ATCC 58251]
MAAKRATYNSSVEAFREHEFPMLKDSIYLDHAGTTLYSRSLVDRFAADMMANLLGNPHAASASSQAAGHMIEDIRIRTLQFFGADPAEFDLIFVANATAGAKLVAEAFRALPGGFSYAYHQACHTSLVGVREEAGKAVCLPSGEVEAWAAGETHDIAMNGNNTLFAYPAQSNMDGRRFPLSWSHRLRNQNQTLDPDDIERDEGKNNVWTLLDAAAYAATSPLDLSDVHTSPDFTIISFYKIFGFPDLGGLIVRRPADHLFDSRRYFGGGTVDMVVCSSKEQWHATKGSVGQGGSRGYALHDRLEDGTLPVHSIFALAAALETHATLFGSMAQVASHTRYLADRLYTGLAAMRHGNGMPLCHIYSPEKEEAGAVVAFNLQNALGAWVSLGEFDKLVSLKKIHLRTGSVCNPGGVAAALGLEPWEMRRNFSRGMRCGSDEGGDDIVSGKPTGIIRVSLGAMSTAGDVDGFLAFLDEFYRDNTMGVEQTTPPNAAANTTPSLSSLFVAKISVYPIKSCGAFDVPQGTRWAVRPEGLAWDREWCLVHRGTRRALSQKQHPKMALLRPVVDFDRGVLRVSFAGKDEEWRHSEVSVPLSNNPAMFAPTVTTETSTRSRSSRVCGEEIAAQVYTSEKVSSFFSRALGVPCLLARFPPGGQGTSIRHSKAHLQKHQHQGLGDLPSPPDSDSERDGLRSRGGSSTTSRIGDRSEDDTSRNSLAGRQQQRILLSNESPILAIHMASLRELNAAVRLYSKDGNNAPSVPASVFRANIVLDSRPGEEQTPYAEDGWSRLQIGQQSFKMLGSCRRCHMVCINQETGAKNEEPFVTLTKTRRFDGKVFFGTHMGHDPDRAATCNEGGENRLVTSKTPEIQHPTIMVGDCVSVE